MATEFPERETSLLREEKRQGLGVTVKNPKVDAYVSRAERWRDETEALRAILLDCGLSEELKWGKPCYTFQGRNVVIIQGFKPHCALMFFKGALLRDPEGVLVEQGKNSQAARRMEFTEVGQVLAVEPTLKAYLAQAIEVEQAGLEVDFKAKRELVFPVELVDAFDENPDLGAAFDALTPGRQRAYVLHFSGAKKPATRATRIVVNDHRKVDHFGHRKVTHPQRVGVCRASARSNS